MNKDYNYKSISCCVCNSTDFTVISDQILFGTEEKVSICNNCGLVQLNPRMTDQHYKDYYAYEYNKHYRPKVIDGDFNKIKVIITRLKAGGRKFDYKNILEIGSGSGESLRYLQRRLLKHSTFYAIEPSPECKTELKNSSISIISDYLEDVNLGKYRAKFDLIILRHVAEHFTDPVKNFKLIYELLSEDGLCYIAVPNSLKPTIPIRNNHFRNVHTYYYNRNSIRNALGLANLEIEKLIDSDYHQISELIVFARKNTAGNDFEVQLKPENIELQKDTYKRKLKTETKTAFKILYYFIHRSNKYQSRFILSVYSLFRYI